MNSVRVHRFRNTVALEVSEDKQHGLVYLQADQAALVAKALQDATFDVQVFKKFANSQFDMFELDL